MKIYEAPIVLLIALDTADILTTSDWDYGGDDIFDVLE